LRTFKISTFLNDFLSKFLKDFLIVNFLMISSYSKFLKDFLSKFLKDFLSKFLKNLLRFPCSKNNVKYAVFFQNFEPSKSKF
jgi:hypothetical protein